MKTRGKHRQITRRLVSNTEDLSNDALMMILKQPGLREAMLRHCSHSSHLGSRVNDLLDGEFFELTPRLRAKFRRMALSIMHPN